MERVAATGGAREDRDTDARRAVAQPAEQPSVTIGLPDGEGFSLSTDREQLRFGRITRPPWATEIGRDVYGLWVMFEVKGVRQRLRWIPPGRFLMGSPPEEAGSI